MAKTALIEQSKRPAKFKVQVRSVGTIDRSPALQCREKSQWCNASRQGRLSVLPSAPQTNKPLFHIRKHEATAPQNRSLRAPSYRYTDREAKRI